MPLSLADNLSVDEGREVGALREAELLSGVETGGEVWGVIAAAFSAPSVAVLSLPVSSRECVSAGVRGGDCMVDMEGEEGPVDAVCSCALLDSREAACWTVSGDSRR